MSTVAEVPLVRSVIASDEAIPRFVRADGEIASLRSP
jgi:hypothetical protein